MLYINLGCGPFLAPSPWINIDIIKDEYIKPDIVLKHGKIWELVDSHGFKWGSVDKIYLGHVLEHIPWHQVFDLIQDCKKLLKDGGQLCIVGPDVYKTLELWKDDIVDLDFIKGVLEDDLNYQMSQDDWSGASHKWNFYLERMTRLLYECNFNEIHIPLLSSDHLSEWPVVAYTQHQSAVIAVK